MPTITRQQRRHAERTGKYSRSRAPHPAAIVIGVLAVIGLGWFVWDRTLRRPPTRDGAPSWSHDGRQIVYFSEQSNGKADLFVMNADGTNPRVVVATPEADEGAPAFSPDGKSLAFDTDRDGNFEIYLTDVDGNQSRRLTRHPGRDLSPAWSPDSSKIAFMSDRGGKGFDVHIMNADGTNIQQVTTTGSAWFPQFSPDGDHLAMHIGRDVHVLDLKTRALRRLTADPANGMYPSWSNDGRIAFMTWRNGRTELFTMFTSGEQQERLVSMPRGGAIDPRWSPDGKRIVFVNTPEATPDAPQSADQWRVIYVVDLETRKMTRLSR